MSFVLHLKIKTYFVRKTIQNSPIMLLFVHHNNKVCLHFFSISKKLVFNNEALASRYLSKLDHPSIGSMEITFLNKFYKQAHNNQK